MKQPLEPIVNTADEAKIQLPLVLGSSSPRRQEILQLLEIPFSVITSTVDESILSAPTPMDFVCLAATEKCRDVANRITKPSLVIGADTIVCCPSKNAEGYPARNTKEGQIIGKPKDKNDARSTLQFLSGRTHEVITAIALLRTNSNEELQIQVDVSAVRFRQLSDSEIEAYIETDEPHDKAGSYALQGEGAQFIESVQGDLFNVMGLPFRLLCIILQPYYNEMVIPKRESVERCLGRQASRFLPE